MLEIGTKVFGEWSIDEKIGSGAFGTVYKIKRENFGTNYYAALKVINIPQDPEEHSKLRSEGMDNNSISTYYGQIAQDFIKEIDLLSSLDGITNIVDYKDHNIVPNDSLGYTIYIKMQLLTPLSKKLVDDNDNAAFLSADEILNLGIDICSALEVCEKHKIIHRDIKIDNIFMSANGDYKLGDFGIAKQLEATQGEMSKKGTMMYMAPEVFKGENYNHTVDIYSLGIVMYRLFNKNRAPFFPQYPNSIKFSDKETANAQRLNGAELPAIPGISEELMGVLRKACAFKAEDRYQSAAEFKKELKNILKILPNEIIAEPIEQFLSSTSTPIIENVVDTSAKGDIENTVGIFAANSSEISIFDTETIEECADDGDNTVGIFVPNVSEIKTSETETIEGYADDGDNTVGVFIEPESLDISMESNENIEDSIEDDIEETISDVSNDELKNTDISDVKIAEPKQKNKNKKFIIIAASIIVLLIGIFAIFNNINNDYVVDDNNIVNETNMSEKSSKATKKHKETTTDVSDSEENQGDAEADKNIIDVENLNNEENGIDNGGNDSVTQKKKPTKKTLPNVKGLTESEALKKLKDYDVKIWYEYTSTTKGVVLSIYQQEDGVVQLNVSAGSEESAWNYSNSIPSGAKPIDSQDAFYGDIVYIDTTTYRYRYVYQDAEGNVVNQTNWTDWEYYYDADSYSHEYYWWDGYFYLYDEEGLSVFVEGETKTTYKWRYNYL